MSFVVSKPRKTNGYSINELTSVFFLARPTSATSRSRLGSASSTTSSRSTGRTSLSSTSSRTIGSASTGN